MKISDLGGEFSLIDRLVKKVESDLLIEGIGDDAAVIRWTDDQHLLVTTDMLLDGDHFNTEWYTPYQIGWKSMVANLSDIAAMGGEPMFSFVSIAIPDDMEVEFLDGLYEGMQAATDRYGGAIVGGDTTHGKVLSINIAVLGIVAPEHLCRRGDAEVGDLICVTGPLGGSWGGLELLFKDIREGTTKHLEPDCRLDISSKLAPHVNAMIDVSDGLASEVRHICHMSGTGAVVHHEKVPLHPDAISAGKRLNKDPYRWALGGGEDFELVFTIPPGLLSKVEGFGVIVIGEILPKNEGIQLMKDGESTVLSGGYDHFSE